MSNAKAIVASIDPNLQVANLSRVLASHLCMIWLAGYPFADSPLPFPRFCSVGGPSLDSSHWTARKKISEAQPHAQTEWIVSFNTIDTSGDGFLQVLLPPFLTFLPPWL